MKTINISGMTDNAVDAILAWAAEDNDFDFDKLTPREVRELASAYPDVDFTGWIRDAERRFPVRNDNTGFCYEALIMERDDDGTWG